ncbi:MAG: hypothetical protein WCK74_10475 [Gemmatimonadaceae bacterium]
MWRRAAQWRDGSMQRAHRTAALAIAVLLLSLVVAPVLIAQASPPRIDLRVPTNGSPASVAVRDALSEKPFDELLRNGFPTRLHFRVELWTTGRWVNDLRDVVEWDVIVQYDVIERNYDVLRSMRGGLTSLGSYARFGEARAASELPFAPALSLPAGKRGYLVVRVDVQTLDVTDLAEMQRWLEGEARPAVQGRRNPGTAVANGLRTLATRLLGGEVRRLEVRSPMLQF